MKKIFITAFTLLSFNLSYSQQWDTKDAYVNGVHIREIPAEYVRLDFSENSPIFLTIKILVDYGQMHRGRDVKLNYLVDENGEEFKNVGSTWLLNLFAKNGWEYVEHKKGSYYAMEYLLRRKDSLN